MADLLAVQDLSAALAGDFDAVVVVAPALGAIDEPALRTAIAAQTAIDAKADDNLQLVSAPNVPGGRLVLAPTGPVSRDHDDVRRFGDAAGAVLVVMSRCSTRRSRRLPPPREE